MDAESLWAEWSAGRLAVQGCRECGRTQHPPSRVCGHCHSTQLEVVDWDGRAELVTWSTVHRAPSAEFAADVPYTICIVSLPTGALVEAPLRAEAVDGTTPAGLRGGQQVDLVLDTVAGRTIPVIGNLDS